MIARLAPSILSCDPGAYGGAIVQLAESGADYIHLDVMDGQFVPPITFGAALAARAAELTSIPIEAHLMTQTPEAHVEAFAKAGCRRISFHIEATDHPHRLAQQLIERGILPGVAINPGTPVSAIASILDLIDVVVVMTVNPGWGGQRLIESCVDKVAELRAIWPEGDIEVDGGVDLQTLPRLLAVGATTFVAGSYLVSRPSLDQAMGELRAACG